MTLEELNALSDRDYVARIWGSNILSAIDNQHTVPMTMEQFLDNCTACGGNWGGMLLTGIQKLYPEVYNAIPEDMGIFAWSGICRTIKLLGVECSDETRG